jgi:hypothetical protein
VAHGNPRRRGGAGGLGSAGRRARAALPARGGGAAHRARR